MGWTYQLEYIRCGRHCRKCPHGPYWYRYQKKDGRTKKEYVGRYLPFRSLEMPDQNGKEPDKRFDILCRSTASVPLACLILGIEEGISYKNARRVWTSLVMIHHPDRGGNVEEWVLIAAAWSYLRDAWDWV